MLDTLEDLVCLNELQQLLASENDITRMKVQIICQIRTLFPELYTLSSNLSLMKFCFLIFNIFDGILYVLLIIKDYTGALCSSLP